VYSSIKHSTERLVGVNPGHWLHLLQLICKNLGDKWFPPSVKVSVLWLIRQR
jgi:hypothetical protein